VSPPISFGARYSRSKNLFGVQYFGENCGAKSLARETRTFQYGMSASDDIIHL
jgi:hypothetical protein